MERIKYPAFAVLLGVHLLLAAPAHAEVQEDLAGIQAFKAHDYEKAEQLFLQALSKSTDDKESAGIRENLALVREMLGKAPKDKSLPVTFKEHPKEEPVRDKHLHAYGADDPYSDRGRDNTAEPAHIDDYKIRQRLEEIIDGNLSAMKEEHENGKIQISQTGSTAVTLLPNGTYEAKARVLLQNSETAESLTELVTLTTVLDQASI